MKALDVVTLIKGVLNGRYNCDIVGGYARDLYYGLTPKDIDVCITPVLMSNCKSVFAECEKLSEILSVLGVKSQVMQSYYRVSAGQFNEMLYGVMKITCDDMEIDLLFSKLPTVADYVSAFDYNINQYVLGSNGAAMYLGDTHNDPEKCGKLINLRTDTVPVRKAKMQAKWGCIKEQL